MRRRARRRGRGLSLIEIVVVVGIIAMISAAIAVGVLKVKENADKELTVTNAQTLRAAVKLWWVHGNSGECPTVKALLRDGAIERGKNDRDAWGQPWTIQCDEHDATIVSRGPDKLPDTEDDIRVPPS